MTEAILVLSDLHAPYSHPQTLDFMKALKRKYRPTRIICVGDETDGHAISFHDADPDLDAAGVELELAREFLWKVEKIFPKMDLLSSNHGDLLYRRGRAHGIPKHMLLEYRDVLFAEKDKNGNLIRPNGRGEGWNWHFDLKVKLASGETAYFHHGKKKSLKANIKDHQMCFVCGHWHSQFEIQYVSSPDRLVWGMMVGCSIDRKSLAFAYNRNNAERPIIGHGIIIEGYPKLLPMPLDNNGIWTGQVP